MNRHSSLVCCGASVGHLNKTQVVHNQPCLWAVFLYMLVSKHAPKLFAITIHVHNAWKTSSNWSKGRGGPVRVRATNQNESAKIRKMSPETRPQEAEAPARHLPAHWGSGWCEEPCQWVGKAGLQYRTEAPIMAAQEGGQLLSGLQLPSGPFSFYSHLQEG